MFKQLWGVGHCFILFCCPGKFQRWALEAKASRQTSIIIGWVNFSQLQHMVSMSHKLWFCIDCLSFGIRALELCDYVKQVLFWYSWCNLGNHLFAYSFAPHTSKWYRNGGCWKIVWVVDSLFSTQHLFLVVMGCLLCRVKRYLISITILACRDMSVYVWGCVRENFILHKIRHTLSWKQWNFLPLCAHHQQGVSHKHTSLQTWMMGT